MLANGIVLGVEQVPDGTSASSLEEGKSTFSRIQQVVTELELPNAEYMNIDTIHSTISDKASTQTCFTKEQSIEDRSGIVEAFCGMHLGIHLWKAALECMRKPATRDAPQADCIVDAYVHTVCKLLGHLGTCPEHGHGVTRFPEYV